MKYLELPALREFPEIEDELEGLITKVFLEFIYLPMVRVIGHQDKVLNSLGALSQAIQHGKIFFYRARFMGKFSAETSKALKKLGAKWLPRESCFYLPLSKVPADIRRMIALSEFNFRNKSKKITEFLGNIDPESIAEKVDSEKVFDSLLFKVEKNFKDNVRNITIAPTLTPDRIKRISQEYQKNLQLYIVDWTKQETEELRTRMISNVFQGNRQEVMMREIQKSYGVSKSKAKFLARQETNLLSTKYNQIRYQDAGVNEYKWRCVAGSPAHPVRHLHEIHNGKIFTWDNPPIVNEKGDRKNPGQDFNCRCKAVPVVRF